MQRRRRAAAVLGTLLMLAVTGAGWLPASGNDPEGQNGVTIDVDPSDDLPASSVVTVTGVGFFPDGSLPDNTVSVRQCVPSLGACGTPTSFAAPNGSFSGSFIVVRMLSLSDTTVDCTEVVCEVQADNGTSFAAHHLTFSRQVATTTTRPAITTTTATPAATTTTSPAAGATTSTTRPPAPGVTIPPTTRPRATTTTRASTTTTAPPATTTTVVPPAPPPDDRPPLLAVTPKNQPSGPAGTGLEVSGQGYACDTVYVFFDGTRVGSTPPDASGVISVSGLAVPGDAGTGPHQVTTSCAPEGRLIEQTALFDVVPVSVHRPMFVTSLALPDQISLDLGDLLASAALAVAAILLIAFPFELFNSALEENYDEVRGWFRLPPRSSVPPTRARRVAAFFGLNALAAVICGFLSPDFGINRTSVVLFLGMFVALLVMAVIFSVPADLGIHRQVGEWGKLNFLPGTVLVSIALVAASRLFDFQPGYFYGSLAGLAFYSALSEKVQGKMTAANWALSMVVSVAAFFLRAPVAAAAAEPGASIWWIGVEACLVMIFLWGVEGLAVAMLPIRFMDGRKVLRWNRAAWAFLFFAGVFATVHVLLRPGSGYVGQTTDEVRIGVMVLYFAFGLGSVLFWAYFRFRPERWAPAKA